MSLQQFFAPNFSMSDVPPQEDFDVLPPDKYPVMIEKAEVKQTKATTGHYIGLTLGIIDGPFRGRKAFDNINIHNPNAQCVEIGLRSLSALSAALGLPPNWVQNPAGVSQLVNGVCIASVKVDKNGSNAVRTYLPLPGACGGTMAVALSVPQPQQPQQPYVGTPTYQSTPQQPAGRLPWQK